jgi:Ni,Fe-hydrogenase III small subunit/ferredoxin
LGRCIFCGECAAAQPDLIRFSNEHRMAAARREDLVVTHLNAGSVPFVADAVRPTIGRYFRHALKLRQVSAGGDNSCEMELNASMNVNFDFSRFGVDFVASPRHADGVVVTGPVTAAMAAPLQVCYDAVPDPKIVIAVGADAISGGLFAASHALDRSFFSRHTPDLYVPGNPAHPLTFIDGAMKLTGRRFDR